MAKQAQAKPSTLPDLSGLSLDELTELHRHVSKHLEDRKQARIKELHAELARLEDKENRGGWVSSGRAKARNLNGNRIGNGKDAIGGELGNAKGAGGGDGSGTGNGRTRRKPEVTHQGPKGETWTDRGAVPRWGKAYGANTREDMERFRIKK
ncbi:hypothetical protein EN866_19340 [Mesorhizobium sp. M2D.F.Ca.ET.223.01.1.1]|uniref:hypothetical protein n=1 Tax=unclassified Mesorhizobium TaxID=325217 RepID=UPI000FCBD95F|nr:MULTISPECIES: hypothetical protein [unclassified Mesorhizobium]TGP89315.1 hypothetical protein EN864_19350 [bacterium M00.F.Ca.ET.221.01.1.1]TGP94688.1 hypothetical protein EN865_15220 [bacterium M00.F.Ca.ET.222.01.1.1]RVD58898.1 hypothetical protein EN783_14775 [Mesorhizobium sp. M2D.F.Ca.ET.140.01.1.1]TGP27927.1 hypothetical protein EN875_033260 [Mesorhizobium sp. M2D.F.Ca.ET.232.01.1.1]TGP75856.1 hypothetical protein EN867_15220 [Mesorhizobium sp. M2D.F.Ca.ET.224.01.1.1]